MSSRRAAVRATLIAVQVRVVEGIVSRKQTIAVAAIAGCLASACSKSKAPAPLAQPIVLRVTNGRTSPVWILSQSGCFLEPVALADASGRRVPISAQANDCDDVRQGRCATFGGCAAPAVFRIDPGKSVQTKWDGARIVHETLSTSEAKGCSADCVERVGVAAGSYTVLVDGWSSCSGDCPCEGAPDRPCPKPASLSGPPDLHEKATVALPGADRAEVVVR